MRSVIRGGLSDRRSPYCVDGWPVCNLDRRSDKRKSLFRRRQQLRRSVGNFNRSEGGRGLLALLERGNGTDRPSPQKTSIICSARTNVLPASRSRRLNVIGQNFVLCLRPRADFLGEHSVVTKGIFCSHLAAVCCALHDPEQNPTKSTHSRGLVMAG
jgi:hypothetical protein